MCKPGMQSGCFLLENLLGVVWSWRQVFSYLALSSRILGHPRAAETPPRVLFVISRFSHSRNVNAIVYLHTHPVVLICFLFFPLFVYFQLSNGFSHCSLSSEAHVGPVGAGPFPHCLPASRLLPRVTSVHLPDYAHYYTIGPGMFPSSQIPSWKVCVVPGPIPLIAVLRTPALCFHLPPLFTLGCFPKPPPRPRWLREPCHEGPR